MQSTTSSLPPPRFLQNGLVRSLSSSFHRRYAVSKTLRSWFLGNMRDGLWLVTEAGSNLDWPHSVNEALLHTGTKDAEGSLGVSISVRYSHGIDIAECSWTFET